MKTFHNEAGPGQKMCIRDRNQMLGLSDGGVDVTVEGSNIKVSDDILARLDELKQKIISGEIQVPSELN